MKPARFVLLTILPVVTNSYILSRAATRQAANSKIMARPLDRDKAGDHG
jgi:hypothetical protein